MSMKKKFRTTFGPTSRLIVSCLLLACVALCGPNTARAELIGHWNFDDNVADQSGKGNDGTIIDDVGIYTTYVADFPAAIAGNTKSMQFFPEPDGSAGGMVSIAHSTGLSISNEPAFTISMWVKGGVQPLSDRRIFSEGSTARTIA